MNTTKKVMKYLEKLKSEAPEQLIVIETPDGTVSCRIGDANMYIGMDDSIVFDTE